jgi:hypothetical protein
VVIVDARETTAFPPGALERADMVFNIPTLWYACTSFPSDPAQQPRTIKQFARQSSTPSPAPPQSPNPIKQTRN